MDEIRVTFEPGQMRQFLKVEDVQNMAMGIAALHDLTLVLRMHLVKAVGDEVAQAMFLEMLDQLRNDPASFIQWAKNKDEAPKSNVVSIKKPH